MLNLGWYWVIGRSSHYGSGDFLGLRLSRSPLAETQALLRRYRIHLEIVSGWVSAPPDTRQSAPGGNATFTDLVQLGGGCLVPVLVVTCNYALRSVGLPHRRARQEAVLDIAHQNRAGTGRLIIGEEDVTNLMACLKF